MLVREAKQEQSLLMRDLCPHLVHPVPFLFPLSRHWERAYVGAGVLLYDLLLMGANRRAVDRRWRQTKGEANGKI